MGIELQIESTILTIPIDLESKNLYQPYWIENDAAIPIDIETVLEIYTGRISSILGRCWCPALASQWDTMTPTPIGHVHVIALHNAHDNRAWLRACIMRTHEGHCPSRGHFTLNRPIGTLLVASIGNNTETSMKHTWRMYQFQLKGKHIKIHLKIDTRICMFSFYNLPIHWPMISIMYCCPWRMTIACSAMAMPCR